MEPSEHDKLSFKLKEKGEVGVSIRSVYSEEVARLTQKFGVSLALGLLQTPPERKARIKEYSVRLSYVIVTSPSLTKRPAKLHMHKRQALARLPH